MRREALLDCDRLLKSINLVRSQKFISGVINGCNGGRTLQDLRSHFEFQRELEAIANQV